MIKICDFSDEKIICDIIEKDPLQNVYLYIDIKTYGFHSKNVETSILVENSNICLILYKYYDSLQIFVNNDINEQSLLDLCTYIEDNNFEMISGVRKTLEKVVDKLNDKYLISLGYIFKRDKEIKNISNISRLAMELDCKNIAKLICSDKNIGGHYSVVGLTEQLVDRMLHKNCKNLIIEKDNEIISHFGVYADFDKISVLGGLITKDEYKGQGYGKKLLNDLTFLVQKEKKVPVLYCYDDGMIEWYMKNEWIPISESAKLERIK